MVQVKEMIRIYQENGETVFCLGSSLKTHNTEVFIQADLAACMHPSPNHGTLFLAASLSYQQSIRLLYTLL